MNAAWHIAKTQLLIGVLAVRQFWQMNKLLLDCVNDVIQQLQKRN